MHRPLRPSTARGVRPPLRPVALRSPPDLERVGDLATNFGKYALADVREPRPDVDVVGLGRDARTMVENVLAAYETEDVARYHTIADRDDEVDALCQRAGERIVRDPIARDAGTDPWGIERLVDDVSRLLLSVHDVERVGDHAVHIVARTLYMVDHDPALLY